MPENISLFKQVSLLVGIISVSIGIYTVFFPQTEIEKCESQIRKGDRKAQKGNYWDAKAHYKNAIACEETSFEAGQKLDECNVKANRACEEALDKANMALQSNDFENAKYNYNIALNCDHTIASARTGIRQSKQKKKVSFEPPKEIGKPPKRYRPSNRQRNSPIQDIIYNMKTVISGTFTMGCTSEQSNCEDDETTTHQVTLSTYQIAKYEVTQAQWEAVMGNNPSKFKGCPKCPVEQVSWNDVQEFIQKLNQKTEKSLRLPTEAEWEYAAREGTADNPYLYSGSNAINDVALFSDNSGSKTHEVGTKRANILGLYDMSGNIWEWCSDGKRTYTSSAVTNPKGPSSGFLRVLRGGSARGCRIADRGYGIPANRDDDSGFRLAHSQ